MQIIKRTKNDSYTTICNTALRDKNLSLQAKGLFAYIMALPDTWKIYVKEIQNHSTNGKDSHRTAFTELLKHGYLIKKQIRTEDGRMDGTEYTLIENPEICGLTESGKPANGKIACGFPAPINNLPLRSTKRSNLPPTPEGEHTGQIFDLKTNDISADFKVASMDDIYNDVISVSKKDLSFDKLPSSVKRFTTEAVDFFNKTIKSKFKVKNKSTLKLIVDRLLDGYSLKDFQKVILNQNAIWKDDEKMRQYLRPSTLFGNKFENYLNTKVPYEKLFPPVAPIVRRNSGGKPYVHKSFKQPHEILSEIEAQEKLKEQERAKHACAP